MFKRFFLTICAVTSVCVAAYSASVNVGYCYGKIAKKGVSKVGRATISAAVVLTPEMLQDYKGAKVTAVRVGLVQSEGISDFTGWIRKSLDGDNLDSAVAEPQTGWNEIPLGGGVVISGESLAVGFSFNQEKSNKCISLVGDIDLNANWIAKNGVWDNDPEKNQGVVSVELVVSSDALSEKDLKIEGMKTPMAPVAFGEDIKTTVNVRNISRSSFSGFDVKYDVDGAQPKTQHFEIPLACGDLAQVDLAVNSSEISPDVTHKFNVEVIGEGDSNPANNVFTALVGAYTRSFQRVVLLEEFTTEQCGNCPRAINTIHECQEKGYADLMTVVAHHSGYNKDWLTTDDDVTYLWFFDPLGIDGTFAPAVMLDRTVLDGESVPVNSIGYFNDFEPTLKNATEVPAFVDLDVSTALSDDKSELKVKVRADKMPLFDVVSASPLISVYVVEDGIRHRRQAGISNPDFTHSHVYRTRLTDIWGSPLSEWKDDTAEMEFSCKVSDDWNPDNLSVVAFVHNHDVENVAACNVLNAAGSIGGGAGVDAIGMEEGKILRHEYYTLSGMRIDAPCSGVCIHRIVFSDGTSRSFKTAR